jgi:sodium transport system ATP-binding protein
MPPTVMVEARGLAKTYPGSRNTSTEAVRDLSFSCHAGQIFGLLGPNGAGKTTTLRMLSTVLTPSKGTAILDGFDVCAEPSQVRKSIGFLSGNTGLYPRLTPREVLRYFGRLYGQEPDHVEQRIAELAELFAMVDYLDKRCDTLSSGMKQKVNVARTVMHDPRILILDEPTVGLDILASRTIIDFVRHYREIGRCVIFSTHIMGEVSRLCDRLAIIHKGRVQFDGSPQELREQTGSDLEEGFLKILEESL